MLCESQSAMPFRLNNLCCRFSVRTLLVATTVLSALLGLIGNEANRLRLHRQAARKVHELGGQYESVTGDKYGEARGPWWCPAIRDSLYADSECVWFNRTTNAGLRDEDLAILQHFPRLKVLEVSAPLVTDEALVHVEGIKSLRELTLCETQVTNRGLRCLRGIPLEKLVLAGPHVTDETLEALEIFPTLRKLMVLESSVTDVGLAHLEHVPNLEKIYLSDSPICGAGMVHLAKLTRLHELDLMGLAISDAGIVSLAALPKLQHLDVSRTPVTEVGLLALRDVRTLKYLSVGPQASSHTLNTLSTALPGCEVFEGSGFRCLQGW
jgi:hypothetical protein